MQVPKIESLDQLMSDHLGPGKTILSSDLKFLTAPGENYMSTMLSLVLRLKDNESGKEEQLDAVAKVFPSIPDGMKEFMEEMSAANFANELTFYQVILPCLKEFQRKHGVKEFDVFPKLIAGRRSLRGKGEEDVVDGDAVIVLENLTSQGFGNADRHVGFNLEEAKVVLKDLATFHATPLALKLKEPQTFEEKIKNRIRKPGPPPQHPKDGSKGGPPDEALFTLLSKDKSIEKTLAKIKKFQEDSRKEGKNPFDVPSREPFATLTHNDMWLNNTMQKYSNGELVKNVFVDFQMYNVHSPLDDLLFLIFTSIQPAVVMLHLDRLLRFYHENFIETLKSFGCDTRPFAYDKFLEEIRETGPNQLSHSIFMSMIIFGKKGTAMNFDKPPDKYSITDLALEKSKLALRTFESKGWI